MELFYRLINFLHLSYNSNDDFLYKRSIYINFLKNE